MKRKAMAGIIVALVIVGFIIYDIVYAPCSVSGEIKMAREVFPHIFPHTYEICGEGYIKSYSLIPTTYELRIDLEVIYREDGGEINYIIAAEKFKADCWEIDPEGKQYLFRDENGNFLPDVDHDNFPEITVNPFSSRNFSFYLEI